MENILKRRPEYDMKATGAKLRKLRVKHQLTEQEVGKYLYVSAQAVHKWEHGRCFPTVDNLFALCELYGVNPLEVMVKQEKEIYGDMIYVGIKETNINMLNRMKRYIERWVDGLF